MNPPSLGQQITFFRKKTGLKQRDLAVAIGISPSTVSSYEKDKRQPDTLILKNLAKTLNVTVDALLGLESPENAGESNILRVYRNLNDSGQDHMLEYAAFLEENPKYNNFMV